MGDSSEMRELLLALIPKVESCKEQLKAQEVLHALFGLMRIDESAELMQLFVVLIPKVETCQGHLRAHEVSDVMQRLTVFKDNLRIFQ